MTTLPNEVLEAMARAAFSVWHSADSYERMTDQRKWKRRKEMHTAIQALAAQGYALVSVDDLRKWLSWHLSTSPDERRELMYALENAIAAAQEQEG